MLLQDLYIASVEPGMNQRVDILIGQDHAEVYIPLQVRRGDKGVPFAVRTLFGQSINGSIPAQVDMYPIFYTAWHSRRR